MSRTVWFLFQSKCSISCSKPFNWFSLCKRVGWNERHPQTHTYILQFRRNKLMREYSFRNRLQQTTTATPTTNLHHRNYCTQICYVNEDDMPILNPTESECNANLVKLRHFDNVYITLFCKNYDFIFSSADFEVWVWKKETILLEFCIVPWIEFMHNLFTNCLERVNHTIMKVSLWPYKNRNI